MDTNSLMSRLMRVFRLDASVYREVAGDPSAATQAYLIVGIAAAASAVGAIVGGLFGGGLMLGIVTGLLAAVSVVVGYVLFSLAAALIAQYAFQGKTNFQEMMRTVGFVYGWNILGILNIIPLLNIIIGLVILALVIWSTILALRESAEFDMTKAVITAVVAGVIAFFVNVCVTTVVGAPILALLGVATGAGQ
jgi:hypothetical protein